TLLARYIQGAEIDQPLAETRLGTTVFYEQDGLGTVTSLSGLNGTLTNTYTYDTFGNVTGSTGSFPNPLQYTGHNYDPETGLLYYRARYYDQTVGRFLTEDPARFGEGIDFYIYVLNNPLIWRDPEGEGTAGEASKRAKEAVEVKEKILCAAYTYYCLSMLEENVSAISHDKGIANQDGGGSSLGIRSVRALLCQDVNCKLVLCKCPEKLFVVPKGIAFPGLPGAVELIQAIYEDPQEAEKECGAQPNAPPALPKSDGGMPPVYPNGPPKYDACTGLNSEDCQL